MFILYYAHKRHKMQPSKLPSHAFPCNMHPHKFCRKYKNDCTRSLFTSMHLHMNMENAQTILYQKNLWRINTFPIKFSKSSLSHVGVVVFVCLLHGEGIHSIYMYMCFSTRYPMRVII
ncbi:hypothetical protein KP509_07G052200 [Ceratopteris richardii]|uniref:Uncharacterized protein n=1 Tax=Ceratopteris richardii TaxID=49495 RepID=A0A8T2UAX3_CERRI|nr:hypothetical protein KP509_07G052200 [Ceratopteris richardii]